MRCIYSGLIHLQMNHTEMKHKIFLFFYKLPKRRKWLLGCPRKAFSEACCTQYSLKIKWCYIDRSTVIKTSHLGGKLVKEEDIKLKVKQQGQMKYSILLGSILIQEAKNNSFGKSLKLARFTRTLIRKQI